MRLTGAQLQKLQDKYNLYIDLEDGRIFVSRKTGELKPETIAKMLGLKETPASWRQDGRRVTGL